MSCADTSAAARRVAVGSMNNVVWWACFDCWSRRYPRRLRSTVGRGRRSGSCRVPAVSGSCRSLRSSFGRPANGADLPTSCTPRARCRTPRLQPPARSLDRRLAGRPSPSVRGRGIGQKCYDRCLLCVPWRAEKPGFGQAKGRSSIGRALVSKTRGWGFKSLRPCGRSAGIRVPDGEDRRSVLRRGQERVQ